MDTREWLDKATIGVTDPDQARQVRAELMAHVSALVDELTAEGYSPADAAVEALRRMGDAEAVGRAVVESMRAPDLPRRWAGIVGAVLFALSGMLAVLGAFTASSYADARIVNELFWAGMALAVAGAGLLIWSVTPATEQGVFAGIWKSLRRHGATLGIWAVLGILSELAPERFAVRSLATYYAWPWEVVGWVALFVAVVAIVLRMESLAGSLALLAAAAWTWVVGGVVAGQIALALWPNPPAAFAAIYDPASQQWARLFSVWWTVEWIAMLATGGTVVVLLTWGVRFAVLGIRYWARKDSVAE